jgi:uncharacterized protein (DUF488 family)
VRIWTIGHSTRKIEDFIAALEAHGIKLLVDVRSLPGSKRYPQFNKETLAKSLQEHGIHYEHFAELGGRRKPRSDSHNIAWRNASFRGYADYMETEQFQKGVERLLALAREAGPAVIMCAEAIWWRCHRALISDSLKRARHGSHTHRRCKENRTASIHVRSAHPWRHAKLHERQRSVNLARLTRLTLPSPG